MFRTFRFQQSVVLLALALAAGAFAGPIAPTGQARSITGQSVASGLGGDFDSGHQQADAVADDYGQWSGFLSLPGVMSGYALQDGGFNGSDTITLNGFSMSLSGGNGPGSSAFGFVRDEFTYSFTVEDGAQFAFHCGAGCAAPGGQPDTNNEWSLVVFLRSDSGNIFRFVADADSGYTIDVPNLTGTLAGGEYTLSFIGQASVSFQAVDSGNGQGGGAGGNDPIMTFHVSDPRVCAADLGVAGGASGQDGLLDNNDFIAFIHDFFDQNPVADKGVAGGLPGSDGRFDNNDFIVFISQFFDGC